MKHTFLKSDFHYDLPETLIARYPLAQRSASRLLLLSPQTLEKQSLKDCYMPDFIDFINKDDLLVFNNTRVLPARLYGQKPTGGKVEIMIERVKSEYEARAYLKASKTPKVGTQLLIGPYHFTIIDRHDALFTLKSDIPWQTIMQTYGDMPIPPYLDRQAQSIDDERYQTVYAKIPGAVAAPTAGLHFDESIINALANRKIATAEVTLHVGAGTFQPVREENLNAHVMHEEWLMVDKATVTACHACKKKGGRVIAIGTTSLRALESAAQRGGLAPYVGDTDLFISPGYQFKVVDALFTNFHLPESTLIMLVSAFAGYHNIRQAYIHAIAQHYRFYSYGDAMFIDKNLNNHSAIIN